MRVGRRIRPKDGVGQRKRGIHTALYTMGDLHLSLSTNKPMDIFGDAWVDHPRKIRENWPLCEDDTIVLAGDLSWGMTFAEADADFAFVDALPGTKILLKGNHDYWWQTQKKLANLTQKYPSLRFLHNNAFETDRCFVCGTRGWMTESESEEDQKILKREEGRLRLSLDVWKKSGSEKPAVVFLHYPPLFGTQACEGLLRVLHEYGVKECYYGHLHGPGAHRGAVEGERDGLRLKLISADRLAFVPFRVTD